MATDPQTSDAEWNRVSVILQELDSIRLMTFSGILRELERGGTFERKGTVMQIATNYGIMIALEGLLMEVKLISLSNPSMFRNLCPYSQLPLQAEPVQPVLQPGQGRSPEDSFSELVQRLLLIASKLKERYCQEQTT